MVSTEIQRAIDSTAADGFWEEKVDWQAQEPLDEQTMAVVAVATAYVLEEADLTDQEATVMADYLDGQPACKKIVENVRSALVIKQLGHIVPYDGTESIADIPCAHDPAHLRDPLELGV